MTTDQPIRMRKPQKAKERRYTKNVEETIPEDYRQQGIVLVPIRLSENLSIYGKDFASEVRNTTPD